MPAYKYDDHFPTGCTCPPEAAEPASGSVFRAAFDPLDEKSFEPRGLNDPAVAGVCEGWGLSLWSTREKVIKKFAGVLTKHPLARKRIGTHVAAGALVASHGVTVRGKGGHITLHQYAGVQLEDAFELVSEIVTP